MPVSYAEGKIYKIVNSENDLMYIGSTAQRYLSSRMSGHRAQSKLPNTSSFLYSAMKEIGPDKFQIRLIKLFPCTCKEELEAEEYRILDEIISDGFQVYNDTIGGKVSEAHRHKVATSKLGQKNPLFNYGNLRLKPMRQSFQWIFSWSENGISKSKAFSINKYGFWTAHDMAVDVRRRVYPEWKNDEELELEALLQIDV